MRERHLPYLVCPQCKNDLVLARVDERAGESIKTGILSCSAGPHQYPIVNFIPRFVPAENYASGFGYQWTKHARTQYDNYNGTKISETRFFEETKWPRRLEGQLLLEVGCGAGRFTAQAASTGAMVVSLDYSNAVEANYAAHSGKENVLVLQADLYRLPLRENSFDKLFCFGVLQHTPEVKKAFLTLPCYLKSGGCLAIDVYAKYPGGRFWYLLITKYWVRPFTRRMPPEKLYRWVQRYLDFMWPLARQINKIPILGRRLNWQLLIADYRGVLPLSESLLKEWAVLDTFDMLSPRYDFPQSLKTVRQWFQEAGLRDVEVHYGFNGIEGRGSRP